MACIFQSILVDVNGTVVYSFYFYLQCKLFNVSLAFFSYSSDFFSLFSLSLAFL